MKYEYKVKSTGEIIEVEQKITDDKLTSLIHPKTRERVEVERMISENHVIFTGDNWADKKGL